MAFLRAVFSDHSAAVLLPVWVADQQAVYDALEAWAVDDPLLGGKLDLQRIGSFGHSFGGATALAVCQVDPRCRAAANLDGGVSGDPSLTAPRPLRLMTATSSRAIAEANRNWSRLIEAAGGPAYWLELPDSNHLSFTISPLISPLLRSFGSDAEASLRTVDRYVRILRSVLERATHTAPRPQCWRDGCPLARGSVGDGR